MTDFTAARRNMVDCQLRPNKVTDPRLVAAMSELPRERFVPSGYEGVAYVDAHLPLDRGRSIMEPMVLARLLELAEIQQGDVVLDIGCSTGYSAAVIAALAGTVVALESDPVFAGFATKLLLELGCDNVAVVEGPLADGYPSQAPFDVIFIDGAIAEVPEAIRNQLKKGGRLVAVLTGPAGVGQATVLTRTDSSVGSRAAFDAATPELPEFAAKEGFVF
ncbi:MAG: protein-L-isoaspartate O-methyltransferase [Rhodospirillaceae bacterium]|nr:MAG: protein-L-isoaspartate O-methyltransferase [Rhodospirillaceae bacterium]